MSEKVNENIDDLKEKVIILTVKLEEYLKDIEESKDSINAVDVDKQQKIDKLIIVCADLKDSINNLEKKDASQQTTINFIVKAFWIVATGVSGVMFYLFKNSIDK